MPCFPALVSTISLEVPTGRFVMLYANTVLIDNIDLGTACGKFFRVGCLSITDAGDSDIIQDVTGATEA